jgi:acyl-coenzyme A synthetase/AMP-(fatty) acid ligase
VAFRSGSGPWTVQPHVRTRIDAAGHLWVSSASASTVEPGEWYDTGDLAEPEEGGFHLRGRTDDLVKIGGRRVALGEVEAALCAHPGVSQAAVVPRSIRGETRLAAFVETGTESPALDPEALKRFVRTALADHKVPAQIRLLSALPRGPAGKVLRRALAEMEDG